MKIAVHRQACCSQDDQLGPLEAEYVIEADATFSSLIEKIIRSGFLQFSSTHNRISGEVDNKWLVEIFAPDRAPFSPDPIEPEAKQPEFNVNPDERAVDVLSGQILSFRFRHV